MPGRQLKQMAETILRAASLDDADLLAALDVAAWRANYADMLSPATLSTLDESPFHDRTFFAAMLDRVGTCEWVWLVEQDGRPVGYCHFGLCQAARTGFGGEIGRLYLLPAAQGKGLGTRIIGAAARRLVAEGLTPIRTTVLEGNRRARRFCERLGGRDVGRQVAFEDQGQPVWERIYGWSDATPLITLSEAGAGEAGVGKA